MSPDPVILVLEDERAQILTLRSQLSGIGKLVEFSDPKPALEYARSHACDAAIVDIRMPRASMDGIAFLHALREFDRDLAVIIRTANDSDEIADRAIELRAIKRAVKSKTTLAELQASAREAVRETRERRRTTRDARDVEATRAKLTEALGFHDLRLAAADVNRGLVHTLRDRLTVLSALSAVLADDARKSGDPDFAEHAARSVKLVAEMVDSVNGFLDGPFGDGGEGTARAAVNICLSALRQFLEGVERWASEGKRIAVRDLMSDTFADTAPLELVNALRHLAEFFLARVPAQSEVSLVATLVHSAPRLIERVAQAECVLNREAIWPERPYVLFRLSGRLPDTSLEQIREAFSQGPADGRTGNLLVLGESLAAAKGAVLANCSPGGVVTVEAIYPVAL